LGLESVEVQGVAVVAVVTVARCTVFLIVLHRTSRPRARVDHMPSCLPCTSTGHGACCRIIAVHNILWYMFIRRYMLRRIYMFR
jgi:hypothetical protein